jgi:hypothetical protein
LPKRFDHLPPFAATREFSGATAGTSRSPCSSKMMVPESKRW